jgi:hypothetical protein
MVFDDVLLKKLNIGRRLQDNELVNIKYSTGYPKGDPSADSNKLKEWKVASVSGTAMDI